MSFCNNEADYISNALSTFIEVMFFIECYWNSLSIHYNCLSMFWKYITWDNQWSDWVWEFLFQIFKFSHNFSWNVWTSFNGSWNVQQEISDMLESLNDFNSWSINESEYYFLNISNDFFGIVNTIFKVWKYLREASIDNSSYSLSSIRNDGL